MESMKKNSMFIRSIALLLTATVLFFAQGVYAEGGLRFEGRLLTAY